MSITFYKDVILDTLKSKTALATDVNGKVVEGVGGGIPQVNTDPDTPSAETAWVLRSGGTTGGGKIQSFMGLGMPYLTVGSGGSYSYAFSYRTKEGTTKRVSLT